MVLVPVVVVDSVLPVAGVASAVAVVVLPVAVVASAVVVVVVVSPAAAAAASLVVVALLVVAVASAVAATDRSNVLSVYGVLGDLGAFSGISFRLLVHLRNCNFTGCRL